MPKGRTHDTIAIFSIVPLLTVCYVLKFNIIMTLIFMTGALFSQFMFGPDLDAKSTQYKRWGIFKWLWVPYRKLFSHRSRFTHGIILGPVFRFLYLFVLLSLMYVLADYFCEKAFNLTLWEYFKPAIKFLVFAVKDKSYFGYLVVGLAGLSSGAAIHTFSDKIVSFFKNLF